MSAVFIAGLGVVSPAGWGLDAFRDALAKREAIPVKEAALPGSETRFRARRVPPPTPRPSFFSHARLRRASPITQFAVAAALEALGVDRSAQALNNVGVIVCVFSGCVNYSRRFYDETLKDPAVASPVVFPETVFNAPASHISAYLGSKAMNYTLVGDAGTFLTGMSLAGRWLLEDRVDECLVVGTEELDWLTAQAVDLFDSGKVLSEGAGAVLLRREGRVRLDAITEEHLYVNGAKAEALRTMARELGEIRSDTLLVDSTTSEKGISKEEHELWKDVAGRRCSPKKVLGEGLMAGAAWQFVAAADALMNGGASSACISIAGFHQHSVGARIVTT